MVYQDPNQNALPQGDWKPKYWVLPAASSVAIGSQYTRGIRYVYTYLTLTLQMQTLSCSKSEACALADLGGCAQHTPPMGPNSFVFAYIFTEKCPRRRSMPPQRVHAPPTGNPGSATGVVRTVFSHALFSPGSISVALYVATSLMFANCVRR